MIVIVDYGMGNLRSVQKGFEKVGQTPIISGDRAMLAKADKVVLPGVGAFRDAMTELEQRDLVGPLKDAVAAKKPFLGICLGMQCMVIEYARSVCGMKGANSTEFDDSTSNPVIDLLPEQKKIKDLGGTMRLGNWPCQLEPKTLARKIYGKDMVEERHRHRYEVNPKYIKALSDKGFLFSGRSPNRKLMEIAEVNGHPFFLGTQFHPEFTSRPLAPNPIFYHFIGAALKKT